jgi:hypothetical protein
MKNIILFLCIVYSLTVVVQPFTASEKAALVAAYNTYRNSQISPPAVSGSMSTITWDVNLETIASNYAKTCPTSTGTLMPHVNNIF